jgi:hypothetical protein
MSREQLPEPSFGRAQKALPAELYLLWVRERQYDRECRAAASTVSPVQRSRPCEPGALRVRQHFVADPRPRRADAALVQASRSATSAVVRKFKPAAGGRFLSFEHHRTVATLDERDTFPPDRQRFHFGGNGGFTDFNSEGPRCGGNLPAVAPRQDVTGQDMTDTT